MSTEPSVALFRNINAGNAASFTTRFIANAPYPIHSHPVHTNLKYNCFMHASFHASNTSDEIMVNSFFSEDQWDPKACAQNTTLGIKMWITGDFVILWSCREFGTDIFDHDEAVLILLVSDPTKNASGDHPTGLTDADVMPRLRESVEKYLSLALIERCDWNTPISTRVITSEEASTVGCPCTEASRKKIYDFRVVDMTKNTTDSKRNLQRMNSIELERLELLSERIFRGVILLVCMSSGLSICYLLMRFTRK